MEILIGLTIFIIGIFLVDITLLVFIFIISLIKTFIEDCIKKR